MKALILLACLLLSLGASSNPAAPAWGGKVVGPQLDGWISCLVLSPDGKYLAVASVKDNDPAKWGEVSLLQTSDWTSKQVLTSRDGWVDNLQFGPGGSVLYAAMSGGSDSLFECRVSDLSLVEHQRELDGLERRIALNPAAKAKSDPTLVLVGQDGVVRIRDGFGRQALVEVGVFDFSGPLVESAFAPDGAYLAVSGYNCGVVLERLPDSSVPRWQVHKVELPAMASAVAISSRGRIAFGTKKGEIVVVEAKQTAGKRAFEKVAEFSCQEPNSVELAWLSDGRTVVAAGVEGLKVFDISMPADRALLAEMPALKGEQFTDVVAGPDCSFFTGSTDGKVRQWTLKR